MRSLPGDSVIMDEFSQQVGIIDDGIGDDVKRGAFQKRTQQFPHKKHVGRFALVILRQNDKRTKGQNDKTTKGQKRGGFDERTAGDMGQQP